MLVLQITRAARRNKISQSGGRASFVRPVAYVAARRFGERKKTPAISRYLLPQEHRREQVGTRQAIMSFSPAVPWKKPGLSTSRAA